MSMEIGGYSPYLYTSPQFNNKTTFQANPANAPSVADNSAPQNVVDISASNQLKRKKEDGMSTSTKVALGILGTGATIYGCVVGHRMLNKPTIERVAKNFSEIFRRDISKDEAQKMVSNYQDLLKIENPEEFCQKAFEQVKTDYGYKKLPIKLELNKTTDFVGSGNAAWCSDEQTITLNLLQSSDGKLNALEKHNKKLLIQNLLHEFQHVKQDEYAYRTSRDDIIKACIKRRTNLDDIKANLESLLKSKSKLEKMAKETGISVEECRKSYENILNDLKNNKYQNISTDLEKNKRYPLDELFEKYPKFKPNTDEFNLGLRYIDNSNSYIRASVDRKGYRKQILEAEAFGVEDKFQELFASPWRIPFIIPS